MTRTLFFLFSFSIISCSALYGKMPDENVWRQDGLYCWHKQQNGYWKVIGPNNKCPHNTYYSLESPN